MMHPAKVSSVCGRQVRTLRRSPARVIAAAAVCLLWACARAPDESAQDEGDTSGARGGEEGSANGGEGAGGDGGNEGQGASGGQGGRANQGGSAGTGFAGRGGSPARSGGSGGGAAMGGRGSGGAAPGMGGSGAQSGTSNLPPIQTGCRGYATRFWDCCKPHCAWSGNVSGGVKPINSCSRNNMSVAADAQSSCNGGSAHMCYGLTPWSVNGSLAYGFAATSSGDVCGRCFQLQFTGVSHNGGDDAGSKALLGKTMVVQAINIGFDVGGGQFDIAIPGGGVGAFNACSSQWGVSNNELGAQYGGFLSVCRQQNNNHEAAKACVLQRCNAVFQSRGLTDMAAACRWFVEWYQAADNPEVKYKEIACPEEIVRRSGMRRSSVDNRCGN